MSGVTIPDAEYGELNPSVYSAESLYSIKNKENVDVSVLTNHRYLIVFAITETGDKDSDGKEQIKRQFFIWHKPRNDVQKKMRHKIITKLNDIGLTKRISQETLGKMLCVSTATINKDYAEINKATSLEDAPVDLP